MPNTVDRPRRASLQQGQAIVLIALLILVLFGMLGLAIDSGRGYVDRRDQQAAVDAAALSAGDWYENFADLTVAIPRSVQLYENDLRLYGATPSPSHPATQYVGPNGNLPQDTYTYTWPSSGYTLVVVATNTQFNGYQFTFTTTHNLALAFIQIFGGSPSISIGATATAIVNNQRQTPALLTLSTDKCSSELTGSASLTVLGDVYSNGQACLDSNLTIGGNCYGAAGSNCDVAQYWCYSSAPGVSPYQPPCKGTDLIGGPIVPAPTLPDPGYTANSVGSYTTNQGYSQWNRGTWTEMYPGIYSGNFHLTGGAASCAFLDAGVYYWSGGYTADATGSFLSNELKAPDEGYIDANGPNYNAVASPQFWNQNGTTCSGEFNVSATTVTGGYGIHHNGSSGKWGIELTSVRYDTFLDPSVSNDPCLWPSSCRRESAPSECQEVSTASEGGNNAALIINITRNAPGAQYYNAYVNSNGCDGNQLNFGFVTQFNAPGWSSGSPIGPWPSGSNVLLSNGSLGLNCPVATVSLCNFSYNQLSPTKVCYAQNRTPLCRPPDWELAPQCFANCPPPANLLSQENAPMSLQYPFYTGGDVANENYCQYSPMPGDPTSPCQGAQMTPGAVQFYLPAGACFSQNAQGATYVFAGEQFNWIVIYSPAANTCNETLNGGASTQYIGTIYTPGANWTISGSDRSPLAGQVICFSAKIAGGGQAGIDFNPNYSPAPPAARLIN